MSDNVHRKPKSIIPNSVFFVILMCGVVMVALAIISFYNAIILEQSAVITQSPTQPTEIGWKRIIKERELIPGTNLQKIVFGINNEASEDPKNMSEVFYRTAIFLYESAAIDNGYACILSIPVYGIGGKENSVAFLVATTWQCKSIPPKK